MKLQGENIEEYKRYFSRTEEDVCLVTKFLVDEKCIQCSNVILTRHSQEFAGKDEIFLLEFTGKLDQVYDIIELLHGYDVEISIQNVEVRLF